jgi:hypothetical protein
MRVAIVGNGPIAEGRAAEIDSSDLVVRFNESLNPLDRTGTKTDLLFLANSGKHMQARLTDPAYMAFAVVQNAPKIILPYHPTIIARYHPKPNMISRLMGRRADWTAPAIDYFGRAGKEIAVLPPQFYEECCEELRINAAERHRVFPSTGFIGIRYVLKVVNAEPSAITLFGFTWEGWKRHAWDAEREWIAAHLPPG